MTKYRVVHYINQFYAGIGGEEQADTGLFCEEGPKGPGMAFKGALGPDFEIVATIYCGDNYAVDHTEQVMPEIIETIRKYNPDLVIAGPAFNAGRYGPMCGAVAKAANEAGLLSVTGMYEENPGVEMYSKYTYIVKTANSAAGMRKAVPAMAALCKKLVAGEEVSPDADGYFKRGKKNVFVDKNGAQRAFEMLMAKLKGEPVVQEIEMPPFEAVESAAPIKDMKHAKLALVTDAGLTDKTNSFRLESSRASKYVALSIAGMDSLSADDFSANHGGYDNTQANRNPNVIVPLDVVRSFQKAGAFAELEDTIYSTTGNGTSLKNAQSFGAEIANRLLAAHVNGVILTST